MRRWWIALLATILAGCGAPAKSAVPPARKPPPQAQAAPAPPAQPGPAPQPSSKPATPVGPYAPNELGEIPILELHHFGKTDGRWQVTIAEFAALLQNLYVHGFRPVNFRAVADRAIDLPRGFAPVVLTFDDGLPSGFDLGANGQPLPDTAVGVIMAFHRKHPDWALRGSFYVNAHPFGGDSAAKVRWLVAHGFEVGDHTLDEADLDGKSAAYALHQVGGLAAWVQQSVPGYRVTTFAYPYGASARVPPTTWNGEVGGQTYHLKAALLVGANPAPSPYSRAWKPLAVPRIQVVNPSQVSPRSRPFIWGGPKGWQARLLAHPGDLYVSDGNPRTVTFPSGEQDELAKDLGSGVRAVER